jgi:PKD repeat protein
MKKSLITLLTGIFLGSSLQLWAQAPTPDLIHYKFDGSGTTVPNLASNPPAGTATATLSGGITQGASPLCNGAAIGSGVSSSTDFVNTNWTTNLGTSAWTIAWRSQGFNNAAALYYIFGDVSAGGFRCFTNGVAGNLNWIIRGTGLTDCTIPGGALATPTACAFVYDPVSLTLKGYLNGVLVSTVAQAGGANITGTGPFKVMGYSSNIGAPAGGFLDDFRVYGRALTDAEVLAVSSGDFFTGFLGSDASLCAGDSLLLTTNPFITNTTTWSTGSALDSIYVNAPGTYDVSWSGNCELGADTIVVNAAPVLPAPGFAGPDATLCVGDSATISINSNEIVVWSTGDTTNLINLSQPGVYLVTVNGQCGTISDTLEIIQSALVYSGYIQADTLAACVGDTIHLSSNTSFNVYNWSTGDTTSTTSVTSGGIYVLSVSDACGSGADSIVVAPFYAQAVASFSFTTNLLTANFTDASTGGGTLSYTWSFGDGNTSNVLSPSHTYANGGTYVVGLTVANECGSSTVFDTVVVSSVGIAPTTNYLFKAIPNPASGRVVLEAHTGNQGAVQLEITNLQGQRIRIQDVTAINGIVRHEFDLRDIEVGTYLVNLRTEGHHQTIRLVVH